jgi:hypothetical protein
MKWGNLTRVAVLRDPILGKNARGLVYETGEFGPARWKLLCGCGFAFEIFEKDFPGKRSLRSCGRKECTFSAPLIPPPKRHGGRPRVNDPSINTTVYMPIDLLAEVQAWAKAHGFLSNSGAVVQLLKMGLKTDNLKTTQKDVDSNA